MKIIHLISGNLGQGGAERLVIDLAYAQQKLNNNVKIVCFRRVDEGRIDIPKSLHVHSFNKKIGFSFKLIFQVLSYLISEKPDVVNCHLTAVFPYVILPIIYLRKIKFFFTIHNEPLEEEPRKIVRSIRTLLCNRGLLHFITISNLIHKHFCELYKVKNVTRINNGRCEIHKSLLYHNVKVEIDKLKKNSSTIVLIAVARLSPQKNYPLMLGAMSHLSSENIILIILGRGDFHQFDNICPSNVFFLGGKNNVVDYLSCADAFCMSSSFEGFPISIIEAMSVGLPIISTNVGGISDVVIEGENGFLCDSQDVSDYVSTIKNFLSSSKDELNRISLKNKHDFKTLYSIEICAQSYIDLYKSKLH